LVCGLGGVGGICVDALYRSGFKNLTLIDADKFEITNQNRQIHKTSDIVFESFQNIATKAHENGLFLF
ncbi:ThiF family adenylyltransferase, partial [Campylobacter jejuni]|uniref:ThiF family adenylyltransferase n=1 Tax=Campylobacter jejuni TaxID=197 RepID=UPI002F265689